MTSFARVRSGSEQTANPMSVSVGTNVSANAWRAFFGDGKPGLSVHPYNEKDETTWVLPAAYIGDCEYLGRTIEIMVISADNYLTQIIMPLKFTDRLRVGWNRYEFDPTIAPIVPERGTCRLLHSRSMEGGGTLHRRGLGFLVEHGFMNTELGKTLFMYELMAIDQSIKETHNYEIINTLLNSGTYSMEYEKSKDSYSTETVFERMKWELMTWDIIKSETHSFEKLSQTIKDKMFLYKGEADTWLVAPEILNWLALTPSEKIEYYRAGPAGPKRISDGVDGFVLVGGEKVYAPRGYDVGLKHGPHNQLISSREIGEYHIALDVNRGKDYPKEYTTAFRNIMIYSQDHDQNKELGIDLLYRLCKRVNPETGKFYSLYDGVFTYSPSFTPSDYEADPFMFQRPGEDGPVPIEYFGNMKPGSEPDFKDGHLTPNDYRDMAKTAMNQMGHVGNQDELCRKWDNVVDVINEIRNQRYDNKSTYTWVTELIKNYKAMDKDLKGERHPKLSGKGIPPKLDVLDVIPNAFGFMDLPENKSDKDPPAWGDAKTLPPFFSTMGGLRTIAHAYKTRGTRTIRNKYGFSDEWFKRVTEAVEFLDAVVPLLDQFAPGSVFKDPKYAPSKDHRPDSAGCLIENLVTGTQHPLFINTAEVFGKARESKAGITNVSVMEAKLGAAQHTSEILRLLTDFGRTLSSTVQNMFVTKEIPPFKTDAAVTHTDAVKVDLSKIEAAIALFNLALENLHDNARAASSPAELEAALKAIVDLVLRRNVVYSVLAAMHKTEKSWENLYNALKEVVKLINNTFIIYTASDVAKNNVLDHAVGINTFPIDTFWEAAARIIFTEPTSAGFSKSGVTKTVKSWNNALAQQKATAEDLSSQIHDHVNDETADVYAGTKKTVKEGDKDVEKTFDSAFDGLLKNRLLRTPLVYTPLQYWQLYEFHRESPKDVGPVAVWPSSARDPETPAAVLEIKHFEKYVNSATSGFSEQEHLNANLPPAIRFRHVYPFSTEITNVYDGISRLRREAESSPYAPAQQDVWAETPFGSMAGFQKVYSGKRKVVLPYEPRKQSRSRHAVDVKGARDDDDEGGNASGFAPVTSALSEGLDLNFDKNVDGNFERAFLLLQKHARTFVRIIAQLFVGTPANDAAISATLRHNIAHPFNYLVVRPHGQISAATILKVAANGKTGYTHYGHNKFTLGDDPATQVHYGAVTWYSRPLVINEKNIFRVDNVFTTGYNGGFGVEPMDINAYFPEKNIYNEDGKGSIIVIMLPRNITELDDAINLTGSWSAFIGSDKDKKLHYPTAVFYNKVWGWKTTNPGIEEGSYNPFNGGNRKCNFTVMSAKTLYIHPLTRKYEIIRYGRSHFPANRTGPGNKAAREGGLREYQVFDYSHMMEI